MSRQPSILLSFAIGLLGCGRANYEVLPPNQDASDLIDGGVIDSSAFDAGDLVDSSVFDAGDLIDSSAFDADDMGMDTGPIPLPWPPVCGDGILQEPIEECEPGTASDDGYCMSNCRPCGSSTQSGFYWETTGSCYWSFSSPSSWDRSREVCRTRGGGDLVVYETDAEWAVVRDHISPAAPSFIGLYYYSGWLWIDARPLANPHWSVEPVTVNEHSRAVQSADGSWQAVSVFAGQTYPALCEREARDGWVLGTGALRGHAYLLVKETVSWDFARLRCESYGAHLLTIGSVEEDFFLSNTGLYTHGHSWIGLHDRNSEGEMVWVTGEPVTYVGLISDVGRDTNDCVVRGATQWHWRDCNTLFPYICEMDPPT